MKKIIFLAIVASVMLFCFASAQTFSDLPEDHWAYKAVEGMAEKGAIAGYPDGSFKPDNMVTRAEFAAIVVRTLDLDTENLTNVIAYDDVKPEDWFYPFVNASNDFLTGYKENSKVLFKPNQPSVREDITVALVIASKMNYFPYNPTTLNVFSDLEDISKNLRKYVAIAYENGLIRGYEDGTFRPQANLTRAQVCQLMVNLIEVKEKLAMIDYTEEPTVEPVSGQYPTFDASTGVIDLGPDWKNMRYYHFDAKTKAENYLSKPQGTWYHPSQRLLYKSEIQMGGSITSTYYRDYVAVTNTQDNSVSKVVRTLDFMSGLVDGESNRGKIDLGSNWKNLVYTQRDTQAEAQEFVEVLRKGNIKGYSYYIPSQRTLAGNESERMTSGGPTKTFYRPYVIIWEKDNLKAHVVNADFNIERSSQEPTVEGDSYPVFNRNTGVIDLGPDWKNMRYYHFDSKNTAEDYLSTPQGTWYHPSQRLLYKSEIQMGKEITSTYYRGYVTITNVKDKSISQLIQTTMYMSSPLDGESNAGKIDLGLNWEKVVYTQRDTAADAQEVVDALRNGTFNSKGYGYYTPSQRILAGNESERMTSGGPTKTFYRPYVIIWEKDNQQAHTVNVDFNIERKSAEEPKEESKGKLIPDGQTKKFISKFEQDDRLEINTPFDFVSGKVLIEDSVVELSYNEDGEEITHQINSKYGSDYMTTMYGVEFYSGIYGYSIKTNDDNTITLSYKLNGEEYYIDSNVETGHAEQEKVDNMICFILNNDKQCRIETLKKIPDGQISEFIEKIKADDEFYIITPQEAMHGKSVVENEVVEIEIDRIDEKLTEQIRVDNVDNWITRHGVEVLDESFGFSFVENNDGTITLIHEMNDKKYYCDATFEKGHADAENVYNMVCFIINNDKRIEFKILESSKELEVLDYTALYGNENETVTITLNRDIKDGEVVKPLLVYSDKGGAASINNIKVTSGNTIEIPVSALISVAKQASKNAGARPLDGIYRVRVERTLNGATKSIGYCEFTMATGFANR